MSQVTSQVRHTLASSETALISEQAFDFQRPSPQQRRKTFNDANDVPNLRLIVTVPTGEWDPGSDKYLRETSAETCTPLSSRDEVFDPRSAGPMDSPNSIYTMAELEDTSPAIASKQLAINDALNQMYVEQLRKANGISKRAAAAIRSIKEIEADNRLLLERAIAAEQAAQLLRAKNENLEHRIACCDHVIRPKSAPGKDKHLVTSSPPPTFKFSRLPSPYLHQQQTQNPAASSTPTPRPRLRPEPLRVSKVIASPVSPDDPFLNGLGISGSSDLKSQTRFIPACLQCPGNLTTAVGPRDDMPRAVSSSASPAELQCLSMKTPRTSLPGQPSQDQRELTSNAETTAPISAPISACRSNRSSPNSNKSPGFEMDSYFANQIAEIEKMGFERSAIQKAMSAACYNADRAVEYLLKGIPYSKDSSRFENPRSKPPTPKQTISLRTPNFDSETTRTKGPRRPTVDTKFDSFSTSVPQPPENDTPTSTISKTSAKKRPATIPLSQPLQSPPRRRDVAPAPFATRPIPRQRSSSNLPSSRPAHTPSSIRSHSVAPSSNPLSSHPTSSSTGTYTSHQAGPPSLTLQEARRREKPLPPIGPMSPSVVRGRVEIGDSRRGTLDAQGAENGRPKGFKAWLARRR